jgi:general secretion pathway protein J
MDVKKQMRAFSSIREKGFTLIEILIAISLTAVLVVIVFSALRLAQRSDEKGRERQELSQRMRAVSDRLAFLLRGAYPLFVQEEEKTYLLFDGTETSLSFVTASTDAVPAEKARDAGEEGAPIEDISGLKKVTITAGDEGLKISENLFFMKKEGEKEYVLDPEIDNLKFEYLEVNENESSWVSAWDPEEKTDLPRGVRITFWLKQAGKEYQAPAIEVSIRASAPPSALQTVPGAR